MIERMIKAREEVIRKSIDRYMNGTEWTMDDIRERASTIVGKGYDIFCLDGVPILELHDPEVKCEYHGDKVTFTSVFQYRYLSKVFHQDNLKLN